MGDANTNRRPLGERIIRDRSEDKRKIRDLADLYSETKEAKERLSTVRVSFQILFNPKVEIFIVQSLNFVKFTMFCENLAKIIQ